MISKIKKKKRKILQMKSKINYMNSIVYDHNLNPKKVNQFTNLGNNVKEYLALKIQRGSPRNFSRKNVTLGRYFLNCKRIK